MKKCLIICFCFGFVSYFGLVLKAESFAIDHHGVHIVVDWVNPGEWTDTAFVPYSVPETMHVFYTARYPLIELVQAERGFVVFDALGTIQMMTTENVMIPISGGVLSLPADHLALTTWEIGETVIIPENIALTHTFVFESSTGKRVVADGINVTRPTEGIIIYDSRYGQRTETLRNGSELALVYDFETQTFRVDAFRPLGAGPDGGLNIPDNGYVLSAGLERRFELHEGVLWTEKEGVHFMDQNLLESKRVTHPLNATNPTLESNPGGVNANAFRGTDQLIFYTSDWTGGQDGGTGTNVHGIEAAINMTGTVIDVATHVTIPSQGYVLSGHGVSAQFMRDHVSVGSHITIDGAQVIVRNDVNRIALAKHGHELAQVETLATTKQEGLYDVDMTTALSHLVKAQERYLTMVSAFELFDTDTDDAQKMIHAEHIRQASPYVAEALLLARYALMPSLAVEARGIWHRPNERSLQAIQANMDQWASLGLNIVYVETLWAGYVNHPSEYIERHPDLEGAFYGPYGDDYLEAFISEAHLRGIEVHAWNEIFYTGSSARPLSNILRENPEWHLVNHDGGIVQNNMFFTDPANLGFRDFLIDYHRSLFETYALDGMQFDYIRYPFLREHTDPHTLAESGFTEVAMARFKAETGISGDIRQQVMENADIKAQFDAFRRQQITDTLIAIRSSLIEKHPDLIFSIAIAPDRQQARRQYFQDWATWMQAGYIDHIAPMIYHYDANHVGAQMGAIQTIIDNKAFQYAGIAPVYYGYSVLNNQEQMVEANQRGAFGTIMFASHNIDGNEAFQTALRESTGRHPAVLPHAALETVLAAAVAEQHHKIDTLYLPNGAVNALFLNTMRTLLDNTLTMPLKHAGDYAKLYEALQVVHAYRHQTFKGAAVERFEEDIVRLMRIVDVHVSRDLIVGGFWNPEMGEPRPDATHISFPDSTEDIHASSGLHFAFIILLLMTGGAVIAGLFVLKRHRRLCL